MKNRLLFVLFALIATGGCTTVQKGLVGERHENIGPFAEATVTFLGASTVDLRENELVYLRQFYDENSPEMARLRDLLQRVDRFRDEVVFYSVELVRISEDNENEQQKCEDFADTLMGQFRDSYLRQTDLSPAEFDAVVERIRGQETLLDALGIMQPLIVMTGDYYENLIRETENEALPAARDKLDAAIEAEYAVLSRQLDVTVDRRNELFSELQRIRAFRTGDDSAVQGKPSNTQLERRKQEILAELQYEESIFLLLDRDIEDYIATRQELALEEAEVLDGLTLARRQIVAWIRAHQQLANGVREPGKWFANILKIAEGLKKAQ